MMARTYLKEDDAKRLYQEIVRAPTVDHFDMFLAKVNTDLNFILFEIRRVKYQLDDHKYVGIVNKLDDEPAKLATRLTVPQIQYFRSLVEFVAMDPDAKGEIEQHDALNLQVSMPRDAGGAEEGESSQAAANATKNLSPSEKEATLVELVKDGWLANGRRNGSYSIGVRTFLELRNFLLGLDLPPETKQAWDECL